MLYQHPRQLPHQHLNLKNKFINFKNYKKQKNIIKNKKKIVELRSVTNPETQRPVFLFLPRNRPLPFLPVLFLLLRLAQNPPPPEQPTRLGSATQAPSHQPGAPHLLPILHLQPGIPLPHDPLPPRASPGHADGDPRHHSTGRLEVVARRLERPQRGHCVEANPTR